MGSATKCCSNCYNDWIEGEKYCRYCGARKDKPRFLEIAPACIYGPPPMERQHTFTKCGFTWTTCAMVDYEKWCPHCGGSAPVTAEKNDWGDDGWF